MPGMYVLTLQQRLPAFSRRTALLSMHTPVTEELILPVIKELSPSIPMSEDTAHILNYEGTEEEGVAHLTIYKDAKNKGNPPTHQDIDLVLHYKRHPVELTCPLMCMLTDAEVVVIGWDHIQKHLGD